MGQEFEREHRGISSSLGHDIRNPPRKTKPRGDSVTWVWHHLKVHSLACLTVNADVCRGFGMVEDQYIYTWPHHVTAWASSQHSAWLPRPSAPQQPGRSYVALYGQALEVAFTMIKSLPKLKGQKLEPTYQRGECQSHITSGKTDIVATSFRKYHWAQHWNDKSSRPFCI